MPAGPAEMVLNWVAWACWSGVWSPSCSQVEPALSSLHPSKLRVRRCTCLHAGWSKRDPASRHCHDSSAAPGPLHAAADGCSLTQPAYPACPPHLCYEVDALAVPICATM